MPWGRRTTSAVAAAVVLVIGLSAWGIAAIPGSDGIIRGCVDGAGAVRVVDPDAANPKARACRSTETAVNWNQTGPRGATGERGPTGPQGAAARTVCKDDDLLLCLPDLPDLRARLVVGGQELLLAHDYRITAAHTLREVSGDPTVDRGEVERTTSRLTVVGELLEDGQALLSWFDSARQLLQPRRDAQLVLHADDGEAVWRAQLTNALPVGVRVAGGRVQATFDVQVISMLAP